jgi:hypothetical protein
MIFGKLVVAIEATPAFLGGLGELEDHGEKWRLEHPHDTPPYPFMPSPTFAHSSLDKAHFHSCIECSNTNTDCEAVSTLMKNSRGGLPISGQSAAGTHQQID